MRRLICSAMVLVLTGCGQPISVDKTVEVEPGLNKAPIVVDGPKRDQKITVEFTADHPVDVHVVLGKDENAVLAELDKATPKVESVAVQKAAKSGTLEATIPAGKDYGVYLTNASKKMNVALKLRGK